MDSSSGSNVIVSDELTSRSLPSLFGLCNGTVSTTTMAGKDLDGLIALNDSALSQQIEFILQDATMEQDDNAQEITQSSAANLMQHHHTIRVVKAKESMNVDYDSNSQATSMSPTAAIKLETPPTSTTPITSASELSQTGLESEFIQIKSPKNHIQLQIKQQQQQQQQNHIHPQLVRHQTQQHLQQHLLNGRRIIIRNSSGLNDISTINITNLNNQIMPQHLTGEEEDPELNDENLQDIEEEAKAAEAEEEPSLQFNTESTQIKLENPNEVTLETAEDFIHTNSIGHLPTTTAQLVLPRSITVPVSEALINLQRRPVFISNAGGNIQGGTIVRMPAVLNRNGSMTVFNVVQQNGNVVGTPTTTQLILQTAAVSNLGGNATANVTPLMVTSSAQTNKVLSETSSTNLANHQLPISASTSVLINNASPTNAKTIISSSNNKTNSNNINNNGSSYSRIVANGNVAVSSASPNSAAALLTESQFDNHPMASTSAAALATLNALHNNKNNNTNNKNNNNNNNNNISNNSVTPVSLPSQSTAITTTKASSSPLSTSSSASTSSPSSGIIYQCVDCVEKFDSKDLFDIHRSGHANNMKCAICNMVLKSLKNYEKHCLRCKPYECQICGRVVRFRPNFIKHMRVHTGQQSERHKYKCEVCHKEFMSFEYFKVHKKIHNENVNLTCEICGKVFSALASLRGHSKLHSGVKLHKCDVCGKGFGQRYNLKIHARTHTGDFPYECKICKKKLHTQSSLQTHMQVHQREQPREQSQQTGNASVKVSAAAATSSTKIRYQSSNNNNKNNPNISLLSSNNSVIKVEPRSSSSSSSNNSSSLSPNAKTLHRGKTVLRKNQSSMQSLKLQQQQQQQQHQHHQQQLYMHMSNDHDIGGIDNYNDNATIDNDIDVNDGDIDDDIDDNNSGLSESDLNGTSFHHHHHHNEQNLNQPLYLSEDGVSGGIASVSGSRSGSGSGSGIGIGNANGFGDDSSSQSSNNSLNNLHTDEHQSHLVMGTPTRTIVVNNYLSSDPIDKHTIATAIQQPQHNQAQVIRQHKNVDSVLQQQLLRKTPIIHSTSGLTNNNLHHHAVTAVAQSVVQQTGVPTANILLTSATATSSSISAGVSTKKLTTGNGVGVGVGIGGNLFTTSTIIRSTHNAQLSSQQHQQHHQQQQQQQTFNINSLNSNDKNNKNYKQQQQQQQQSSLYQRNNHRNHHRRRHLTDLDDDDDDDDDDDNDNDNVIDDVSNLVRNNDDNIMDSKLSRHTLTIAQPTTITATRRIMNNGHRRHRPFDDDDDMMADDDIDVDDKCSPSLALTAIKVEPNLYATGDNSNEMLIKEEAIFDNSPRPQSPQSPPSSRYRMSNFDNDLEHHSDLSHSLPTYGYLLDHHTIPDGMPSQLYADDDDDEFKLGHSALTVGSIGGSGSISSLSALNATDTGDFIKKEWPSYGSTSAYSINGKFDDDSDVLCDAASFIYN